MQAIALLQVAVGCFNSPDNDSEDEGMVCLTRKFRRAFRGRRNIEKLGRHCLRCYLARVACAAVGFPYSTYRWSRGGRELRAHHTEVRSMTCVVGVVFGAGGVLQFRSPTAVASLLKVSVQKVATTGCRCPAGSVSGACLISPTKPTKLRGASPTSDELILC